MIFVFVFALFIGFAIGGIFAMATTSVKIVKVVHDTGIDPDALIAWLENYQHNYEYNAPPTTGEIIRKIREMREVTNERYDAE